MNRSVLDKMIAYIAGRGAAGVEPSELAAEFLSPASAPPQLCERLIRNVLSGEPRVVFGADGKWRLRRPATLRAGESGAGASVGAYTVLETVEAASGPKRCVIEWAGSRVDSAGRVAQAAGSAVRPEPWPPGLIVPPPLKAAMSSAPVLSAAMQQAADFARGSVLVSYRIGGFQVAVARALEAEGGSPAPLSLERLAKRLARFGADSREALAARLGLAVREAAGAAEAARSTAEMLSAMLARKEELGLGEPEAWTEIQHPRKIGVDYSGYEFDRNFIEGLPATPGIYIMRDANGVAVYVGKAANLRARVGSYFRARIERDEKTDRILEAVSRVEIVETGSELGALLAEQRSLRELQPAINIQFDVHERPAAAKAPRRRVLLILPAPEAGEVEVFLLHGDLALKRAKAPRGEPACPPDAWREKLRPLLAEFFFGPKPPTPPAEAEKEDLQIVWSWLERNADRVNALDVDLAGGLDGTLALVDRYMQEPPEGGKVIHV